MGLHPFAVHFPIVLALIWPWIDLAGLWRKSRGASAAALSLLLLALVSSFVAVATGQGAYDQAVGRGVSKELLDGHGDPAGLMPWALLVLSLVRTLGVLRYGRIMHIAAIVLGLASAILVLQVGRSGGRLVYEHGVGVDARGSAR